MKVLRFSGIVLALVLSASAKQDRPKEVLDGSAAQEQAEVTLIAPGGIREALTELIPMFEKKTDMKVKPTFTSGGATTKQVIAGGPFDVPVVQAPYQDVVASGNVVAGSAKPLASVSVGVAVRKGAAKPDISTPEAVKKMLLGAQSIAFPNAAGGAAAGVTFEQTMKKLGITDQMQPKIKAAQGGGGAMGAVAKGDIEIGLTFMSEMTDPGIDIVGPLPHDIAPPTTLVGFLSAHAQNPAAAKALLDFLSSPEAAAVYKAHHMQPAR